MKNMGDELDVSLKPKTSAYKLGKKEEPKLDEAPQKAGGFSAVTERLLFENTTKATVATTVRLPEASDAALKKACSHFDKSKADLVKICVEEFLKENKFLPNGK